MDELTFQRSLRDQPPADPHYRSRLSAEPGVVAAASTNSTSAEDKARPMLSAVRLATAATVVALFGGLLLAGVLMQQSDEQLPAVGASPSPDGSPLQVPALDVRDLEWAPLELDPATFGSDARLVDIAASDSMLVIGGSVGGNAAIWTSPDGLDWQRVPHDEAVFGGSADQVVKAVTPWRGGFVAAGEVRGITFVDENGETDGIDDSDPRRAALVWISEDGTTWTRVPHDEAVFGGAGRQEVFDIAATDERVVIAGFDEEGGGTNEDIAVWTSTDGVTWEHDMFGGGVMWAVSAGPDGFVGVGNAVWESADGLAWRRVAELDLGDRGSMDTIAWTPEGFVAAGGQDGELLAWTSEDGRMWAPAVIESELPILERQRYPRPMDVASGTSGLATVVGPRWLEGDGLMSTILVSADGQAWTAVDAPDEIADADLGAIAGFGSHFVALGGASANPADGRPEIWTTLDQGSSAHEPDAPSEDTTSGATIVVAQDGSGDVTSLGEAIDLATSGDRIFVRPGRYVGSVIVSEDIDIVGDGDAADIILEGVEGGPDADPLTIVRFEGGTPRLANLTLLPAEWADDAVAVAGGAPVLEGLVVGSPGSRGGVSFYGNAAGGVVRDSTIHGSIDTYAAERDDEALLIEGNTIVPTQWPNDAERVGIVARRALDVRDNTIRGGDVGIWVEDASPTIEGNHIEGSARGIVIDGGEPQLAGNTVLATETGIDVALAAPTVADNDVRGARVGVALLGGAAGTLSGNRISGNEIGIRVDNGWVTADGPSEVVLGDNDVCGSNVVDLEIAPDAAIRYDSNDGCVVSRVSNPIAPDPVSVEEVMAGLETIKGVNGMVRARSDGAGHELDGTHLVASNSRGDIWLYRGEGELFQLGHPGTESVERLAPYAYSMAVAEDGSVWLGHAEGIASFDGSTWTSRQAFTGGWSLVRAADDGSVWAAWQAGGDDTGPLLTVGRYDGDGWTTWHSGTGEGSIPFHSRQFLRGFEVTPDGHAWLAFASQPTLAVLESPSLVGFDGERWQAVPAGPGGRTSVEALEEGPNGILWVILGSGRAPADDAIIATFDGQTWTVRADEVPGDRREFGVDLLVTDEEVLWLSRGLGKRGLHRLDADGWTMPLDPDVFRTERETMHLGPDGTIWVTGRSYAGEPPILIQPS